jgi:hypothetical protein
LKREKVNSGTCDSWGLVFENAVVIQEKKDILIRKENINEIKK